MASQLLRFVRWAEHRAPGLAAAAASPRVRGASAVRSGQGTLWQSDESPARCLVLCLSGHPSGMRWLAGSIAARLPGLVYVAGAEEDATSAVERATGIARERGLDARLSAVVAEGDRAEEGVLASRILPASRLVLVAPPGMPGLEPAGLPTTLLQASQSAADRAGVVELEAAMRRAGVAVRETEYRDIADEWARYPRAVPGSRRALGDLVAFLERGIGQQSTFEVIPGWDLH